MLFTDNRNVVKWIEFERQIRSLGKVLSSLAPRVIFIITPEHTLVMAGEKFGKVITPTVQHAKSVAPEGTIGKRINCWEPGILIGIQYLETGEIIGEVCRLDTLFQPAITAKELKIEWGSWNDWEFSSAVTNEMFKSSGVLASPADPVDLNISRSKNQPGRKYKN